LTARTETLPFQTLLRLLTLAVFAYALYALLLFLLQRQILYPGRSIRVSGPPPAAAVGTARPSGGIPL
jgi:hypothetical protein